MSKLGELNVKWTHIKGDPKNISFEEILKVQSSEDLVALQDRAKHSITQRALFKKYGAGTLCYISNDDWVNVITKEKEVTGFSRLNTDEGDQYIKEKGRRKSLDRALMSTTFTKEQREAVWADYWALRTKSVEEEKEEVKNEG